jgi:alkylation response protein AidB-like acyl-CoA dehydrogenase
MDLRFTPEQEALRGRIRAFLGEHRPDVAWSQVGPEWSGDPDEFTEAVKFNKKLAEHGWLTAHWPKEYGGLGLGIMEQVVLAEEMSGVPVLNANGLNMLGPILMLYGSDEQKREHLPGIAACEVQWAQGYSEPNAGSDLASLQTRAVRDGDEFVINGSKIWTGHGATADWIFVLARTDPSAPKHKGISFFLMPITSPGIKVLPLKSMTGYVTFCQEYFEDVRVPARNLVGEENQGWYIGAALLDFERSGIGGATGIRRGLERLVQFVREQQRRAPAGSETRETVRHRIADRFIEAEVARSFSYKIASLQASGRAPNHEASMGKVFSSELSTRVAYTGFEVMQMYGQLRETEPRAKLEGRYALSVMMSLIGQIGGGTSEIQRNIIATRGLGLPRG